MPRAVGPRERSWVVPSGVAVVALRAVALAVEMAANGRRRPSLDMSDAPVEALNFREAAKIDVDKATFDMDDADDAIPTIDVLKQTFDQDTPRAGDGSKLAASDRMLMSSDSTAGPAGRGSNPRRDLFVLLDEPDSSALAKVISVVVMLMILASSVSFVLETTEPIQSEPGLQKKLHVRPSRLPSLPQACYS